MTVTRSRDSVSNWTCTQMCRHEVTLRLHASAVSACTNAVPPPMGCSASAEAQVTRTSLAGHLGVPALVQEATLSLPVLCCQDPQQHNTTGFATVSAEAVIIGTPSMSTQLYEHFYQRQLSACMDRAARKPQQRSATGFARPRPKRWSQELLP